MTLWLPTSSSAFKKDNTSKNFFDHSLAPTLFGIYQHLKAKNNQAHTQPICIMKVCPWNLQKMLHSSSKLNLSSDSR